MGKKEIKIPITPRHSYVACIKKAREKANIIVPEHMSEADLEDGDLVVAAVGEDVKDLKVGDKIAAIVNPKGGCMTYKDEGITILIIEQHRIMAIVNQD